MMSNWRQERNMPTKRRDLPTPVKWRRAQLIQAGFPPTLAARVARDERYDLHDLTELVGSGCAPALAVRILEPIELRAEVPEGVPARSRQRPPQE
jgi:hypothetical protein